MCVVNGQPMDWQHRRLTIRAYLSDTLASISTRNNGIICSQDIKIILNHAVMGDHPQAVRKYMSPNPKRLKPKIRPSE